MSNEDRTRQDRLEHELAELDRLPDVDVHRRIAVLNDLAWELVDTDSERAFALSQAAQALASTPGGAGNGPLDPAGLALSLRTQGYLNQRFTNYTLGISQLTQALALLESLQSTDGLADVYDGLAGIYAQLALYPEALGYIHKQLAAAEQLGDRRRMGNAYNNLAAIYVEMNQVERALEVLHLNLVTAVEIGDARVECLSHINLAQCYTRMGEHELARKHARLGLQRSQEAGFELFRIIAEEVLASSFRREGATDEATRCLQDALAASRALNSQLTEVRIQYELARTYQAAHCLDLALAAGKQAAAAAEPIDARNELYDVCLLLSEICEQQGDAAQALAYFKRYHELKESIAGAQANQRLQVLQVAHDTAMAQKEAEQLRGLNERLEQQVAHRTAELAETVVLLKQQIAEREWAEAEIQQMLATLERRLAERTDELATFFDLTLLAGQAGDLGDVLTQILGRVLEVTRSRALCLHFLDVDRTTLRLAGHEGLAAAALVALTATPLAGDFSRWLEQPNDPLVITEVAASAFLPAAFRLPGFQTYLGAQIKIGGRTAGLLSCYRFTGRGYGIDEIALVTALAEQIGMMLEIQRLRRSAAEVAVLAERQRLARDLHDSVTQSLYSLTLFSRAGREAAADGDTARLAAILSELEHTTLHTLREMRLLLYELRPADLAREGLKRALELRLNTVERRAGLQLDVMLEEVPALPAAYEVDLYHIALEALNNVVKHAAASRLVVRLDAAGGHLHLLVADNGKGFDPHQVKGGLGLSSLHERIVRLRGLLTVTSAPGRGTQVEAVFPYPLEGE